MALQINIEKSADISARRGPAIGRNSGLRQRRPLKAVITRCLKGTKMVPETVLGRCLPMVGPVLSHHIKDLDLLIDLISQSKEADMSDALKVWSMGDY
ncbi:hypothetical protein ACTUVN_002689 [Pseudomonas caspiana]